MQKSGQTSSHWRQAVHIAGLNTTATSPSIRLGSGMAFKTDWGQAWTHNSQPVHSAWSMTTGARRLIFLNGSTILPFAEKVGEDFTITVVPPPLGNV